MTLLFLASKTARCCVLLSLWPSEAVVDPCCSDMVEIEESANGCRLTVTRLNFAPALVQVDAQQPKAVGFFFVAL